MARAALASLLLSCAWANKTVVLLGDSLMDRPFRQQNLSSKIAALLDTAEPFIFIDSGNSGEEIASIASRTASVMATYNPWGTIVFWDSDCSNVNETLLSPAAVAALRANYTRNLDVDDQGRARGWLQVGRCGARDPRRGPRGPARALL